MADKKTLIVVVGIQKPASDAFWSVAANVASSGMENINALDLDLQLAPGGRQQFDIGFVEDDKEIALPGILEVFGHVKIGIHPGLQNRDAAKLMKLTGMRVEIERAGDEHVELGVGCLPCSPDEIRTGYRGPGKDSHRG